ncbi:alanine dehydrogenase [Aerococcus urinaehominis]|uniref:Alanine dehydrogenase n=1 Tax=Aerococcus urinaehominis TaxID=128944 RepID=A0A109RGJ3_9LACT|nr:alanine dehydrogenase [Aerococcus urinaehominis]AMB99355.1 alanine dehydrogenase [Aerococcus urinaehominis]SDM22035.1 alanine dehydrogenase [Aerococcus urinaehominis]
MKIGIPTEIKNNEKRVAMTPVGAALLTGAGHEVFIQKGAGEGSNFTDEEYVKSGAQIVDTAEEAWAQEMVMKVKEPQKEEFQYFRDGQILFTYLHLAPEEELTQALMDAGVTAVGYETMTQDGALPLLKPMSEVAGRMAVQIGAHFLEQQQGGKGVLLGAVPGVQRGRVVIIGGGVSGTNAADMAIGLGASVTILDVNPTRLGELVDQFGQRVQTLISNSINIENQIKNADLVIGSVLIPGAKAPTLVTEDMLKKMQPGSVIVDIAIDQGGIFEHQSPIGSLDNPTFIEHDIVHYAVPNMPGAVPRTSTMALTNVSANYALEIANKGIEAAAKENDVIKTGINVYKGQVTIEPVAQAQGLEYTPVDDLLA